MREWVTVSTEMDAVNFGCLSLSRSRLWALGMGEKIRLAHKSATFTLDCVIHGGFRTNV